MRPIHSKGRRRAAIASAVLAMCLALPAAASADTTAGGTGAAHVSISTDVHVSAKVLATVNVSFTCDPFLIYDWQTGESVPSTVGHLEFGGVSLTQARVAPSHPEAMTSRAGRSCAMARRSRPWRSLSWPRRSHGSPEPRSRAPG